MSWLLALSLFIGGAQQVDNPKLTVARLWTQFSDGITHRDVEALTNLFSADARLMEPGLDDIVGRLGIKALFTSAFSQRIRPIDMRMMPREALAYDGVIFDQGDYVETRAPQDNPRSAFDVYGRYFTVWAQQTDGTWKIARMMLSTKKQPAPR